jgi:hypothetical protein
MHSGVQPRVICLWQFAKHIKGDKVAINTSVPKVGILPRAQLSQKHSLVCSEVHIGRVKEQVAEGRLPTWTL